MEEALVSNFMKLFFFVFDAPTNLIIVFPRFESIFSLVQHLCVRC